MLFYPDGISLSLVSTILAGRPISRRSFDDTSLAPKVFECANKERRRVALVGSAEGVSHAAASLLSHTYPEIDFFFSSSGFLDSKKREEAISICTKADIVICSMGTPLQEHFLISLKDRGWNGSGYTCGGYLDQLVSSGGSSYYPAAFDYLQVRWLYRLIREPRRLLPRYLIDYPLGIINFIFDGGHKLFSERIDS